MSNITNHYAEGSCVFEAGSSQNGDITINAPIYQGGAKSEAEESVNPSLREPQDRLGLGQTLGTESPVHLSTTRGTKIDFIRVVNSLYELGLFTDDKGGRISKKEVMIALGKAVNVDLAEYQNDLSRSLSDSTKLEKHLAVFDRMRKKMEEVFYNYG